MQTSDLTHKVPNVHSMKHEGENERELIQGAIQGSIQGNTDAFKRLYKTYVGLVYGVCYRLCADKSQAEDATQEVFIQLWRKLDNFKGESKFSTYLHALSTHVCISYIRKQRSWWQKMRSIDSVQTMGNDDLASFERTQKVQADYSVQDFEALVLGLPERMRHIFVLYAIEGYRHEQIASLLSISINTSKVQYHNARKTLEAKIGE